MNLPSEVVIISGDSRFDAGADKMKRLEAHELLNAAGRAGRAGEGGEGFVLLVPSKVIEFDNEKNRISGHWMDLQAIFEQADQCLIIDDPMAVILDQIHNGITKSSTPAYFLSKLPLAVATEAEDPAVTMLKRSFAAYRARAAGDVAWMNSRIKSAIAARVAVDLPDKDRWIEHLAGSTGVSIKLLQQLLNLSDAGAFGGSAMDVVKSLVKWLQDEPIKLMELVRPESLEGLLGEKYKSLSTDKERAALALPWLILLWPLWMSGVALCQLEASFLSRSDKLGKCEYTRHFVSRIVPDLAFLAGLPARLLIARSKAEGQEPIISTVLATLGGAVREGCDGPEALATRINCGRNVSRIRSRQIYDEIKSFIEPGSDTENFEDTRQRVREAEALSKFAAS